VSLAVWYGNERIATIQQRRDHKLRLTYDDAALRRYAPGTPLLSVTLPVAGRIEPHAVRAFLEGLLPEGEPRRVIASDLGIVASDTYAMIAALGAECAGAFVILPDDHPAPAPVIATAMATPLSASQLAELVANLRSAPLGVSEDVRLSLGGVQEKLVLTRMTDGVWGTPTNGAPSTHILKPDIAEFPNTVENEAFCMRLAKRLGLPVAAVQTTAAGGRALLVVERYDRQVATDGTVERIHQEDLCQALAVLPEHKYEDRGGPSLRNVARILQTGVSPADIEALLRAVVLNVLIGNCDAHGKNFALLHERPGVFLLAPLYDLLSTLAYSGHTTRMSMYIDSQQDMRRVTSDRIINEAASWGMSRRRAIAVVDDILTRAPAAADAAMAESGAPPSEVRAIFDTQLARLRDTLPPAS
jgi:serine/threonine-protein kinase HipA